MRRPPKRIIFYPRKNEPELQPAAQAEATPSNPFAAMNMDMFKNMNLSDIVNAASTMMKDMSPEQLKAAKDMYDNMSDEQRAAILEQVMKMGKP